MARNEASKIGRLVVRLISCVRSSLVVSGVGYSDIDSIVPSQMGGLFGPIFLAPLTPLITRARWVAFEFKKLQTFDKHSAKIPWTLIFVLDYLTLVPRSSLQAIITG
jgi:hypothetical protein